MASTEARDSQWRDDAGLIALESENMGAVDRWLE